MLSAYRMLLRCVVEILEMFPPKRVEREEVELRKGQYMPRNAVKDSTVWVHGASLGDIITLRPLLQRLSEEIGRDRILGTAVTMDGYRRLLQDGLTGYTSLFPIELPELLEPFIERMRPGLVLISETEIWPLFMATLADHGIPYGIVNARINLKTVRFMRLFRSLFGKGIDHLQFVFPQNQVFAGRFRALGIPRTKISIEGGLKFDVPAPSADSLPTLASIGIPPHRQVLCFGSTHPGEESIILDALEPLWGQMNVTIILAPRHLNRLPEVEALLRSRHLDYSRHSQQRHPVGRILLLDTLGELRSLYALADLTFVGGSLVPHGGHSLMEPAAFAKPILSGPYTDNFPVETRLLQDAEAFFRVDDAVGLRQQITAFLLDPASFVAAGMRAKAILEKMAGASSRTVARLREMGLLQAHSCSHGG